MAGKPPLHDVFQSRFGIVLWDKSSLATFWVVKILQAPKIYGSVRKKFAGPLVSDVWATCGDGHQIPNGWNPEWLDVRPARNNFDSGTSSELCLPFSG